MFSCTISCFFNGHLFYFQFPSRMKLFDSNSRTSRTAIRCSLNNVKYSTSYICVIYTEQTHQNIPTKMEKIHYQLKKPQDLGE